MPEKYLTTLKVRQSLPLLLAATVLAVAACGEMTAQAPMEDVADRESPATVVEEPMVVPQPGEETKTAEPVVIPIPQPVEETEAVETVVVAPEPLDLRLGLSSRGTATVVYSSSAGAVLPLGGFVSDTSNIYSEGYANLDKISFLRSDNPRVSLADGRITYTPGGGVADELVSVVVGSSVHGIKKEVEVLYNVKAMGGSYTSLVNSTIASLDVSDSYKRALRELPEGLNPFFVNGVNDYSIRKIEAVAQIWDRVKASNKFGWKELSDETKLRLGQAAMALTGEIHFNEGVLDYDRVRINQISADLGIFTELEFFSKNFEPHYSLAVPQTRELKDLCNSHFEGSAPLFAGLCLHGEYYEFSETGQEHFDVINKDEKFYLKNLAEHFSFYGIINEFNGTVKNINVLSNTEFDSLFDDYRIVDNLGHLSPTGVGWGYGKLNSFTERGLESGSKVNSYNALRHILKLKKDKKFEELSTLSATNDLLTWLRSVNTHFTDFPAINDYSYPNGGFNHNKLSQVQTLINASPNNHSWPNAVNYLIPKEYGGIYAVGSSNIGGAVPSALRLIGVPSEQVIAKDLPKSEDLEGGVNLIKYYFPNDTVNWSEGNFTVGSAGVDGKYLQVCQAVLELGQLSEDTTSEGRRKYTVPVEESGFCRSLN